MVWLLLCIAMVVFIIFCLFLRIYTSIQYKFSEDVDILSLECHIIGIRIFRKKIPLLELDSEDSSVENKADHQPVQPVERLSQKWKIWKMQMKQMVRIKAIVLEQLKKVHVHQFKWITKVGTGDASSTGIYCGSIWSAKGLLMGFMTNHMQFRCQTEVMVNPVFQQKCVQTELSCIVSIKIGQAIYAIMQLSKLQSTRQHEPTTNT